MPDSARVGEKDFQESMSCLMKALRAFRVALNSGQARNSVYQIIEKLAVSEELKQRLKNWWHNHSGHLRGANPGDFWRITTKPFPDAHFAVYPEDLRVRPILSSCPTSVCKVCGRAPLPLAKKRVFTHQQDWRAVSKKRGMPLTMVPAHVPGGHTALLASPSRVRHASWKTCACGAGFEPGIVFDPFAGAGTTLVVAKKLGRQWLGCDLNPKYVALANQRVRKPGGG